MFSFLGSVRMIRERLLRRCGLRLFSVVVLLFFFCLQMRSETVDSKRLKKVTLQLNRAHQFQFAGYYAAVKKGYYRDVGLDVQVKEWQPGTSVVDEVISGRAQFGVENSVILLNRLNGKPVVLLAAMFQHSPLALFVAENSKIFTLHDLIGKKIAMGRDSENAEIIAILQKEGVPVNEIKQIKASSQNIDKLINGDIAAFIGYTTDTVDKLNERQFEFRMLSPQTYGVDFYGDCLFTSEQETIQAQEIIKPFRRASIKGWKYAMSHPEEIAKLIHKKYNPSKSVDELIKEKKRIQPFVLNDLIKIGHINPDRWHYIAKIFASTGMVPKNYSLDGFIYRPLKQDVDYFLTAAVILTAALALILFIALLLFIFNRKLEKAIKLRTIQLNNERVFADSIIESLPGVFYVYEDGVKLIRWNKDLEKASGYTAEELYGMPPLDWAPEHEKRRLQEAIDILQKTGSATVEIGMQLKQDIVPYYLTGKIFETHDKKYFLGMGVDISKRKELERQLIQTQKIESIGRLAAGMAHDFNNIITIIKGSADLLMFSLPEKFPDKDCLVAIQTAAEQASELTQNLLAFGRRQVLSKEKVSLHDIINGMEKLLTLTLGNNIKLKKEMNAADTLIDADSGQIEQVIMNLAVNAKDAMSDGGVFTITTSNESLDRNQFTDTHEMALGPYIVMKIRDTGEGIKQDTIDQIFDPFFTTKPIGKGTGLGLSIIYGIIKQHNGHIYAESKPGEGTEFTVYFPLCE